VNARARRFAGVRFVRRQRRRRAHSFPCGMGFVSWGRLAGSAAVWESRSLPALFGERPRASVRGRSFVRRVAPRRSASLSPSARWNPTSFGDSPSVGGGRRALGRLGACDTMADVRETGEPPIPSIR